MLGEFMVLILTQPKYVLKTQLEIKSFCPLASFKNSKWEPSYAPAKKTLTSAQTEKYNIETINIIYCWHTT